MTDADRWALKIQRDAIAELDVRMLATLKKRRAAVERIWELKEKLGQPLLDEEREDWLDLFLMRHGADDDDLDILRKLRRASRPKEER